MSKQTSNKLWVFYSILIAVGLVFLYRITVLQLFKGEDYLKQALRNSSTEITLHPVRGTIYDRNGKLIVYNDYVYDLLVVPIKTESFDTLELCRILEIDTSELEQKLRKAKSFSSRKPSLVAKNLSTPAYSVLQENLFRFPGFYIESKTDRKYKVKGMAHVLGYTSEVNKNDIENDPYYKQGDLIGVTGIEKSYEKELRGKNGVRVMIVDKHNIEKGNFADGFYDTEPIPGQDLFTTIDLNLQELAETFLSNKTGSIVAIEPATGEVLCIANSPGYDPNELSGPERNKNFRKLLVDPKKPLFNRALKAPYPPGSTFKPIQALIGLQEGVITPQTAFPCYRGYILGNRKVGCHAHASPVNLKYSIQTSCNAYYCYLFRDIVDNPIYSNVSEGLNAWIAHLNTFGLGILTDIDIPGESKGILPSVNLYKRVFGKNWRSSNVISVGIGQGEVGVTPLQMANYTAIIANRGYFIRPHVVKYVGRNKARKPSNLQKHNVSIDTSYFPLIVDAMNLVYQPGGTAFWSSIPGLNLCGKTGTAQNPHGNDHSIFIGFGPKDNPKIAIAVIIENGGFGATWAAPIASLLMERYLKQSNETAKPEMYKRMLNPVNK
ncbi:MAG: penicillin-binding protein 2 [Bacteroidetes bacterium]|nr:penicillin-binding protein 2 [Bacteroidota bacterium]